MSPRSQQRHVRILERRRDFLKAEIEKQGMDASSYDKAEHAALVWALEQLRS